MNQPMSSCAGWTQELVRVTNALSRSNKTARDQQVQLPERHDPNIRVDDTQDDSMFDEDQTMFSGCGDEQLEDSDVGVVDEYPRAAATWGRGQTFMDRFDSDVHANDRIENLYYPFASKQDWEIGEFLERSSLSMAAIDEFLALDLVSSYAWPVP